MKNIEILYSQENCDIYPFLKLNPGKSSQFAWDNPLSSRSIVIKLKHKTNLVINYYIIFNNIIIINFLIFFRIMKKLLKKLILIKKIF